MEKYSLPLPAKKVISKLNKAGFEAWAVGGCVRDLIMGRAVKDWDFATNALPEKILELFPDGFYNNVFGTVGVPVKTEGQVYEITTYRREHRYSDFRHPDKVTWGKSITEDLSRRDFTINAIAFDGKRFVDPFGGTQDIKKRMIRAVGDPEKRFREDALRLLRAVRLSCTLGFLIEEETFQAIKKKASLLSHISAERIRDELLKILESNFPDEGIVILRNSGLLSQIVPELERCFGVPQQSPKRHHIYDVGTHLIKSLKHCPVKDPIVRLATLLHDIGKPITFNRSAEGVITFYNHEIISASIVRKIANRLRFSIKDRDRLYKLVRWHQFSVDERQTDSAIRRFIRNVGRKNLDDILALRIADRLGGGARETSWRLELFKKRLKDVQKQPFTVTDLKVDGHDVMRILNIKPGPTVGAVLNHLFAEVEEDNKKNKRGYLLRRIKEVEEKLLKSSS